MAAESEKKNPKESLGYWLRWIKAARKAAKRHIDDSKAAWREYENQSNLASETKRENQDASLVYPAYWSATKVIEPAYYSMTPNPDTIVEFDWKDSVAETASMMAERTGKYMIRTSNFDMVMSAAVGDFIHADKATTQVICDIDPAGTRNPLTKNEDGSYNNGQELHTGDVMRQGEDYFFSSALCKGIKLGPLSYDEVLHTPNAKIWGEVTELAIYFCISKDEADEKFENLPQECFKTGLGSDEKSSEEDDSSGKDPIGKYLEGWECYDKETKMVYFVSESCPLQFLKPAAPDPYKLPGFFPCAPFIIGSKPSKSLYPTPAYIQVRPTLQQMHVAYGKIFNLLEGARRRAIVDGAAPELIAALNDLSANEFVGMQNINDIVSKGGLKNMIFYIPVEELVKAVTELQDAEDRFEQNFQKWFGVPEILQGISDPIETLGAQEMKRETAHDRFRYAKKQVAQLARDSLEMLTDLAFHLFDNAKIAKICGYQYMTRQQQADFPAAIAILRDNDERLIRIDIETDSIAFVDQRLRAQQRKIVSDTVNEGLKNVSSMVQINPTFAAVSLQVLLATLDGLDGGKYYIEEVKDAGEKLIQAIENPPQTTPPPDYEMLKINNEAKKNDEAQQLKVAEFQWKQKNDTATIQLKDSIAAADNNIKMQQTEISGLKVQNDAQVKQTALALQQSKDEFAKQLDGMLAQLEQIKTGANVAALSNEEARAKREEKMAAVQMILDHHTKVIEQANGAHRTALDAAHTRIGLLTDHVKVLSDHINAQKPSDAAPAKNMEDRTTKQPDIHVHLGGSTSVVRGTDGKISKLVRE